MNKFKKPKISKKIRPVVKIEQNGQFKTIHEWRNNHSDFGFVAPIDKFFKDKKVNRLIYKTK